MRRLENIQVEIDQSIDYMYLLIKNKKYTTLIPDKNTLQDLERLEDVAVALAHEIGHLLGMKHDEVINRNCCRNGDCIMSETYMQG